MELKEKTGETAVISAGHGQTSLLTNNLFQVTNPFFSPPRVYQWLFLLKRPCSVFAWPFVFPKHLTTSFVPSQTAPALNPLMSPMPL